MAFSRLPRRYLWLAVVGSLLLAAAASAAVGFTSAASARRSAVARTGAAERAQGARSTRWITSWTASQEAPKPGTRFARGFHDLTIRNIIYTSAGGRMARVRFSNTFGRQPLRIGGAAISVVLRGAATAPGRSIPLTFAGRRSLVIPAGQEAVSDPVQLTVRPLELLALSVYLPGRIRTPTQHTLANQISYLAVGDHALDTSPAAFRTHTRSWYFVTDLEVARSPHELGTVVALGDSITDGYRSRINANDRWPNYLARRLDALRRPTLSAVDAGISGNKVLCSAPRHGLCALARFGRDVLAQPGVTAVIVLEGVNDIGAAKASAPQLIAAYKQLIARAHAHGLKIFGATLTPFRGAGYWTPVAEATRERVNAWIRTSGAFDGVIDFARALADPGHPQWLNPAYDSGDHLHPSDAGYRAMGNAVSLAMLQAPAHP